MNLMNLSELKGKFFNANDYVYPLTTLGAVICVVASKELVKQIKNARCNSNLNGIDISQFLSLDIANITSCDSLDDIAF